MLTAHKTEAELRALGDRQLRTRRAALARQLPDVAAAIRGSVSTQGRRCGRESCRCASGQLHGPYVYLSVQRRGRSRLLYVPAEVAEEVGRRIRLTAQIEATLAEISAINLELLGRGRLD
jgi:hypothetical protein